MRHPHAYPWHEGHTDYHLPAEVRKAALPAPPATPQNDQAAGVGVKTFGRYAGSFGTIDKAGPKANLKHYDYSGKAPAIDQMVGDHGYQVYYAGGKHGQPDLASKNYNTGHLMVYDPSAGSGADFGEQEYTDSWRKVHELAHALTYPQLNEVYGEGRRIGALGKQRSAREAQRAVHWEWLAAHKQRELSEQLGVHIPDHLFHRELNTVMGDAVHRAITGKFTEPSDEGFTPHSHKVPLEHALDLVRAAAQERGLQGPDEIMPRPGVKKTEGTVLRGVIRASLVKIHDDLREDILAMREKELRGDRSSLLKSLGTCAECGQAEHADSCRVIKNTGTCKKCGKSEHEGQCKSEELSCAECHKDEHAGPCDKAQLLRSEDFLVPSKASDPKKREKNIGGAGFRPDERPIKQIPAEGSGGKTKLGKSEELYQRAMQAIRKAAGSIPSAPKAPSSAGGGGGIKVPQPTKPKKPPKDPTALRTSTFGVSTAAAGPAPGGVAGPVIGR